MTQSDQPGEKTIVRRILTQVGSFVLVAAVVGVILGRVAPILDRHGQSGSAPAGFGRGVVQGILMPMALPNLLVGRDVAIYSIHNTGVSYKLGYTVGVNVCGAVFFGWCFWRLRRFRNRAVRRGNGDCA